MTRPQTSVSVPELTSALPNRRLHGRGTEHQALDRLTAPSGPSGQRPRQKSVTGTPQVTVRLVGRAPERGVLDQFIAALWGGESQALVVLGEPGIGKTALLDDLAGRASGCRLVSVSGVQSEMELAFAALHQLCAPLLGLLDAVPAPQALALRTAFGMRPGPVPDRFLVGLSVLSLLAEAAADRPLLCIIDDEQWLDRASAQVMAFVARRLGAESVGLIFGTRAQSGELAGLPQLKVEGLPRKDARALLDSVLTAKVDEGVLDQVVAEAHGNPLALVELPQELKPADLAGGFGLPGAVMVPGTAEEMFRRRIEALPAESKRLLALAAAEPTGDPVLLWRAAGRLGIQAAAARPAVDAGLVDFGARVRFRHPLARSSAYRSAPTGDRRAAHAALAQATDPGADPDRRAWHQAKAAPGPDEDVAGELERSASRAQARGGLAAAAAFLQRATALTPDPVRQRQRALSGAQAKVKAGELDAALDLLAIAESGSLAEEGKAHALLVRAELAYAAGKGSDVQPLLLAAAKHLEPVAPRLARMTYLDAMRNAIYAGRLAGPGADLCAVSRAAAAAPQPPDSPDSADRLLFGLTASFAQEYAHGLPALRKSLLPSSGGLTADEEMHCSPLAAIAAAGVWDYEDWEALTCRYVDLCRELGALTELRQGLCLRAFLFLFAGDLAAAESVIEEAQALLSAIGTDHAPYSPLGLAAFRGREAEVSVLARAAVDDAVLRGEGWAITGAAWASALVNNGLCHYRKALDAAQRATEYRGDLGLRTWAMPELVEAAARSDAGEIAATACRQLAEIADDSGTDWALGVKARSQALLVAGDEADGLYQESISCLGRTCVRPELARAHLLYGEWLRRERRRGEARTQLRKAHTMLEEMGMAAFAERARRELWATGETTRKRSVESHDELTAQELQVARLARAGLTNPEIGTRLFISPRTVEYHLGKVFAKLGITSRRQLDNALS
jgi:DNA-binding CsgD family transcriptional regulator